VNGTVGEEVAVAVGVVVNVGALVAVGAAVCVEVGTGGSDGCAVAVAEGVGSCSVMIAVAVGLDRGTNRSGT
jgi:hypothetical protein